MMSSHEHSKLSTHDRLNFIYEKLCWLRDKIKETILPSQEGNDGRVLGTNGTSLEWITLPSSGNALLTDVLTVNVGSGQSVGGSSTGESFAAGTPLETILRDILIKSVHPTYVPPTASLNSSVSNIGIEAGTTISPILDGIFVQNNAGSITSLSVLRNGIEIASTEPYTDNNRVITSNPTVYKIAYSYADGVILNDNLGNPDPTGRITAESVETNSITYIGYYRIFLGPVISAPTNSAEVRSLPVSRLENEGNSFILNTGATRTKFAFWLPNSKTLVSVIDQDASFQDITTDYVQTSLSVNDAGGTPIAGKLYVMTQTVPYSENHKHSITIS